MALIYPDGSWHDPFWAQAHLKILAGRQNPPAIVPLRYNIIQWHLNKILAEEERCRRLIRLIILKARQEGVSTWVESVIYGRCRRVPQQTALILSHDPDGTAKLYAMFTRFYDNDHGAPPTKSMHQKGLTFASPHGSMVTVQTAAKRFAGTGGTIQMAHLSEVAKWPFPDETMLSLMQAMPAMVGTFAVIESTAYGAGGFFHEQWQAAVAGESQWRPVFFPWFAHNEYQMGPEASSLEDFGKHERYNFYHGEEPEIQHRHGLRPERLAWRRWCIDNNCGGDVQLFRQEYPATPDESFIAGGSPRFPMHVLQQWYRQVQEPIFVGSTPIKLDGRQASSELLDAGEGWLRIWEMPKPGEKYILGADCAGCDPQGDHNAATVLKKGRPRWSVVATIHGLRGADIYARAICNVGLLYNEATVAVEVNGIGEACQSHLRHWYPERATYHRLPIDKAKRLPGERIGWYTGHITRHNLIEDLDAAIRNQSIEVPDEDTILELLNFQRVPGQRNGEAKPGMHDDRVFALGIALQAGSYKVSGEYDHFEEERHVRGAAPMAGVVG